MNCTDHNVVYINQVVICTNHVVIYKNTTEARKNTYAFKQESPQRDISSYITVR